MLVLLRGEEISLEQGQGEAGAGAEVCVRNKSGQLTASAGQTSPTGRLFSPWPPAG